MNRDQLANRIASVTRGPLGPQAVEYAAADSILNSHEVVGIEEWTHTRESLKGRDIEQRMIRNAVDRILELEATISRVRDLTMDTDGNDLDSEFNGNTVGDIRAALDGV